MSKMMDRSGRLFGKVSIIDVLVVLVVLVMAVAMYVKNNALQVSKTGEGSQTPITFVVEAENIPLNVVEAVRVGDQVFDKDRTSNGAIGTITGIEIMEAGRVASLDNGTYVRMKNETARNLIITVEGTGTVEDGRYAINQVYEIGVNAARNFYTSYTVFTGSVIEIH